jgi:hypothetical protein
LYRDPQNRKIKTKTCAGIDLHTSKVHAETKAEYHTKQDNNIISKVKIILEEKKVQTTQ